jgi:hypothetical protein
MVRRHSKLGRNGRETETMKAFTVAAVVVALIAAPAHAQMGGKRHRGDDQKTDQKKPQVDEKAYKAALERIPEPKEKYDPWGVARPTEPAKKSK